MYRWTGDDGRTHVRGAEGLKDTQAYPPQFGEALARLYQRHEHAIKRDAEDDGSWSAGFQPYIYIYTKMLYCFWCFAMHIYIYIKTVQGFYVQLSVIV